MVRTCDLLSRRRLSLPLPPFPTSQLAMLPRHLRRSAALAAALKRSVAVNQQPAHFPPPYRIAQAASVGQSRSFHSSRRRLNEVPKSPFQTFVEVLKDELKKNRELLDNVKQLQGDVDKFQDSEAMRKARAAYERARVSCTLKSPVWMACLTIVLWYYSFCSLLQVSKKTPSYALLRKS